MHRGANASPPEIHPRIGLTECVVDAEKKLVRVKFAKKMTVRDIERYAKRLQSNPSFRPDYSEIVDLTDVEVLDLQAERIPEIGR